MGDRILFGERKVLNSDYEIFVLVAIYFVAILSRYTPTMLVLYNCSIYICMVACIVWMVYIRGRIVEKRQRYYLYSIAVLLICLHFSQLCKYSIFDGLDIVERHMWYAYYIPTTLVPLISLYISVTTGKASRERLPVFCKLLLIPAVIQILLIMTNDFHQLVFSFNPGFEGWRSEYHHQIIFYINTAWTYILVFVSIILIQKKSYMRGSRRGVAACLIICILHYVINVLLFFRPSNNLTVFGVVPITSPMLYSMTFILLWEAMIHVKLFPSNSGYEEIFDMADISAEITDRRGKVVRRSDSRVVADSADIKKHTKKILGGMISWSEDISAINALNKNLMEVGDELEEANALLIEEAEVKAKRAKLKIENEIYDEIGQYMKPHFDIIEKCLDGADELPESEYRMRLILASFEACFVKRGVTLLLTIKSGEDIKKEDFSLAVNDLFSYARMAGVDCGLKVSEHENLTNDQMIEIFENSEKMLYESWGKGSEVRILWD